MRRLTTTMAGLLVAVAAAGCSAVAPDAGQEAVLTRKPLIFGHGGVDADPVTTGRTFTAWTTRATYVNMQPQRVDVEFSDLMTKEGIPIDFHSVVTIQVTDSVALVEKFGADYPNGEGGPLGAWTRNIDQPYRTAVRDHVKNYGMSEIAIQATASATVDQAVGESLNAIIQQKGVPFRVVDLSLGRANPPEEMMKQRIETAAQEQRVNTERQRALAENMRLTAEQSRASADQAYIQKMGLNPAQYVALEAIKMQREVCMGGKCTFLLGGGVVPTLEVQR